MAVIVRYIYLVLFLVLVDAFLPCYMPVVKSLEVQYLAIEVGKTVDYDGFNYDTLSSVSLETISR